MAARHHPEQPLLRIDDGIESLALPRTTRVAEERARLLERHRRRQRDDVGAHDLPDEQDFQRID